jgi:hypothetical protein
VTGQPAAQQGQAQWTLKAVLAGGRDVTDSAIDLKPGENIDNVTIVLTDRTNDYHLRNLPPGDYLVYVTDNAEQGEWFDPSFLEQARNASTRLSITDGEKKTQDLSFPGAS